MYASIPRGACMSRGNEMASPKTGEMDLEARILDASMAAEEAKKTVEKVTKSAIGSKKSRRIIYVSVESDDDDSGDTQFLLEKVKKVVARFRSRSRHRQQRRPSLLDKANRTSLVAPSLSPAEKEDSSKKSDDSSDEAVDILDKAKKFAARL